MCRFLDADEIKKLKQEKKYCEAFQTSAIRIEKVLFEKVLPWDIKTILFIAFDDSIGKNEEIELNIQKSYKMSYSEMKERAQKFFENKGKKCYKNAEIFVKNYKEGKSIFTLLRKLCENIGDLKDIDNEELIYFYEIRGKAIHQPSYLLDALTPGFQKGKEVKKEIISALDKAINFLNIYDKKNEKEIIKKEEMIIMFDPVINAYREIPVELAKKFIEKITNKDV